MIGSIHPSAETMDLFVAGRLPDGDRAPFEAHLDECRDCRQVLSALARGNVTASPTEPVLDLDLVPPRQLGRYLVIGRLGSGGMGVVWDAYDPRLNRKVAIKVLKRARFGEKAQREEHRARFIREARAMALLSHPNVAQVYDIGEAGDDVFIAMELLTGGTLRQWLARGRTADELISTFLAAGRGLAAAHAAGLVHRDFKPDNVLLGADGQVKVTDFGLARPEGAIQTQALGDSPVLPLETVTIANEKIAGTPKYMSPEQRRGAPIDARSDQYGYCIAFAEALERAKVSVPDFVLEALERGLSPTPDERFPTMEALLAALQPPPPRRWPTRLAAALILTVVGGTGAGLRHQQLAEECGERAGRLSALWTPAETAALEAHFEATGDSALSRETFQRVKRGLGEYDAQWTAATRRACLARNDAALRCLDGRLARVTAAVEQLRTVTATDLARVPNLVNELPVVRSCENEVYLQGVAVEPPPKASARAVTTARGLLDQAAAADSLGRGERARALVDEAGRVASELGFLPVEAEIAAQAAKLQATYLGAAQAERRWVEAIALGSSANHRLVIARSWLGLSDSLVRQQRVEEAEKAAEAARATLEPFSMIEERIQLLRMQSALASRHGHFEDSLRLAQRCVTEATAESGARSLAVAQCEHSVALALNSGHRREQSIDHLVRAAELLELLLSPNHPSVARAWSHAGFTMCEVGRFKEGLEATRKGLSIARRTLAADNPELAQRLVTVSACSLLGEGRTQEQPELAEAVAIVQPRPEFEQYPEVMFYLGVSKFFREDYPAAIEVFSKTVAAVPKKTPAGVYPLYGLGRSEFALGQFTAAREHLAEAHEVVMSEAARVEIEAYLALTEWHLGEGTDTVARLKRAQEAIPRLSRWEFIDNRFVETFTRDVHREAALVRALEAAP